MPFINQNIYEEAATLITFQNAFEVITREFQEKSSLNQHEGSSYAMDNGSEKN